MSKNPSNTKMSLVVEEGPDLGMTYSFTGTSTVSIGRSSQNDFVLNDQYVSKHHGEIQLKQGSPIYVDLKSRHGSTIIRWQDSEKELKDQDQAQSAKITQGSVIKVGTTRILVDELATPSSKSTVPLEVGEGAKAELVSPGKGGHSELLTTRQSDRLTSLPAHIEPSEKRLSVLFELASELNGLRQLDDMLNLIAKSTFRAFPEANFFAVTLMDSPEKLDSKKKPFFTRHRDGSSVQKSEVDGPLLSTQLLERTLRNKENVLFVKDSVGPDASESIVAARIEASLCAPLLAQDSVLGAVQVDTRGKGGVFSKKDLNLFSVLASQAAFSIERAQLSENIVQIFESFVEASVSAVEARDATTAGHSRRVADYARKLAEVVDRTDSGPYSDVSFSEDDLEELKYAALLHDFGKIGVPEQVLNKSARLDENHLEAIKQRFEKLKALDYERRLWKRAEKDGSVPKSAFSEIKKEHESWTEKLDQAYKFIVHAAEAPGLDESEVDKIKSIGRQRFIDRHGEEHPFLTEDEIQKLTIASGNLTEDEWHEMQEHPRHSEQFLDKIPWGERLDRIPYIAGRHHEKLDGSGYPRGLRAEDIPVEVRMLTIVDIYDALTSTNRSYRDAFSKEKAINILKEDARDDQLDSYLVDLFVEHII